MATARGRNKDQDAAETLGAAESAGAGVAADDENKKLRDAGRTAFTEGNDAWRVEMIETHRENQAKFASGHADAMTYAYGRLPRLDVFAETPKQGIDEALRWVQKQIDDERNMRFDQLDPEEAVNTSPENMRAHGSRNLSVESINYSAVGTTQRGGPATGEPIHRIMYMPARVSLSIPFRDLSKEMQGSINETLSERGMEELTANRAVPGKRVDAQGKPIHHVKISFETTVFGPPEGQWIKDSTTGKQRFEIDRTASGPGQPTQGIPMYAFDVSPSAILQEAKTNPDMPMWEMTNRKWLAEKKIDRAMNHKVPTILEVVRNEAGTYSEDDIHMARLEMQGRLTAQKSGIGNLSNVQIRNTAVARALENLSENGELGVNRDLSVGTSPANVSRAQGTSIDGRNIMKVAPRKLDQSMQYGVAPMARS